MKTEIERSVQELFGQPYDIELTRPEPQFGDYTTNIALKLAKDIGKNPREIAEQVAEKLRTHDAIKQVDVAGPGFINVWLTGDYIYQSITMNPQTARERGTIVLEYSCPNAFKELHTGHLYQTVVWDALARMYEYSGWNVKRVSFGGDVGLHVAKAMWGIIGELGGENAEKLDDVHVSERASFLARCYVSGSRTYEEDVAAKQVIDELNKQIYTIHADSDHESSFAKIYWTARQWSYDYFDDFYKRIEVLPFDKYYPESATMQLGLDIVRKHVANVFTESEGAIVLDESKSGLHTRVFVTSKGLPTYEAKDLGVINLENDDFTYDKRIVATGNDQSEYMKVVFKAEELIDSSLGLRQTHVANGTVKFADGKKMSSRLGNVARAVDVVEGVYGAVEADSPELRRQISLGALKYAFLKYRLGGDIHFDLEQSISTEGHSGPYLQYARVRARSILSKASRVDVIEAIENLDAAERSLAVKLSDYKTSIQKSIDDNSPHHLANYLYELSQVFNRFYEQSPVIGNDRQSLRLVLVQYYADILDEGLGLLGIPLPKKM